MAPPRRKHGGTPVSPPTKSRVTRLSDRLAEYVRTLRVWQGPKLGQPLEVMPFQMEALRLFDSPGTISLSMARKNGKTSFAAAIACAFLDGPGRQTQAEIVVVAPTFPQAQTVLRTARSYLGAKLDDRERWRCLDSQNRAEIHDRETGASLFCVAAKPSSLHGRQPVLSILDECAEFPRNFRDRVWAAVKTSAGAIEGARALLLGTRPSEGNHFFERQLKGPRAVCFAAVKGDDDPFDPATWAKANPALPYFPWLRKVIELEAAEARADALELPAFEALRCNMGTPDAVQAALVTMQEWAGCEVEADELPDAIGGFVLGCDLGDGVSMSATAAYWPATGRLEALAAFPGSPSLDARGRADGVGTLYVDMERAGGLVVTDGPAIDTPGLIRESIRRWGRPRVVVADRYRAKDLQGALVKGRIRVAAFKPRGQGYKDGAEDVRMFRRAVTRRQVKALPSLLIRAALAEARVIGDVKGNVKLAIRTQAGRRAKSRDDVAAAMILAVAEGRRLSVMPKRSRARILVCK